MLLFNNYKKLYQSCERIISKHLMLLFNPSENYRSLAMGISKHLMLLFNIKTVLTVFTISPFQNISCYCLTQTRSKHTSDDVYFKTSHVIV